METETVHPFPEEALQHVLSFIDSHSDRNSVSLVSKSWYDIERGCRRHVLIRNCYAVSPPILIRRFTDVRSFRIKGKLFTGVYDFVPDGWGAHALPWIEALAAVYPALEEIRLQRMSVTDDGLELIGRKLKNLRVLVLQKCEGFSTHGLAFIAANWYIHVQAMGVSILTPQINPARTELYWMKLRKLDLFESQVRDQGEDWISSFPNAYNSLEFLNVDCLKSELHFSSLDRLVERCRNLRALRVNHSFPLEKLINLLSKAPKLVDLGIGLFTMEPPCLEARTKLALVFAGFKGLSRLSGLWDVTPYYLPTIYPICLGLTSLNLTRSTLRCPDLIKLLHHCSNLQRLWVLDFIEDRGLAEVVVSCKELQDLRVYSSDPNGVDPNINLTERGLVSVAIGCPKLHSIAYFCSQMTNAALVTIAEHKPTLTMLRIIILEPHLPDPLTHQPLDNGFLAILESCNNLKRLVITGLVTDHLLKHIGIHGKKLNSLGFFFWGESDVGLHHILLGCNNLIKLGIICSPFGGEALLANSHSLERMRYIWMSHCTVSYGECKLLAEKHPRLNVEVINEKKPLDSTSDECQVENLYIYRTIVGPRLDMPTFVWNAKQAESSQKPQLKN